MHSLTDFSKELTRNKKIAKTPMKKGQYSDFNELSGG